MMEKLPRPNLPTPTPAPASARVQRADHRRPVAVGDIVNGKYLVEQFIGEGGVGVVAAAQNLELDERVALKFLKPDMLAQADIVARFAREAKASCSIKSEYVCGVYDVGTMPDGQPFLVMEYLEGQNLDAVVRERGRLGYREATEYVMQTCEALAVAHAKGIVHRDIKPENLFLTARAGMQIVKVLDFGISKTALTGSVFGNALPLVKTVNLMGSPCYMSPEQVRSADAVDARSDIWSLGIVLYELLTGTMPFAASSITELCAAILEKPLDSIRNHRADLPNGYIEVLEKCLQKDIHKRYQNVAELAIALMPFAPKRARICAERAAQALRAAGLIEESSVRFTSTVPPPPDSALTTTTPSFSLAGTGENRALGALGAPSGQVATSSTAPGLPSIPGAPPLPDMGMGTGLGAEASSPPPQPSKAKFVVAVLAVAAVAAAAAIVTVTRLDAPSAAAAPPPPVTADPTTGAAEPPAPAAVAQGAATAPAPAAAEPKGAEEPKAAGASATVTSNATPKKTTANTTPPKYVWQPPAKAAAPPPAPKATTAPAPATPTTKKSSDEPDLGY